MKKLTQVSAVMRKMVCLEADENNKWRPSKNMTGKTNTDVKILRTIYAINFPVDGREAAIKPKPPENAQNTIFTIPSLVYA